MTTQELVERLTWKAEDQAREASEDRSDGFEYEASIHDKDADLLRAAASRLSEMDAENKRLREALKPFAAQTRASSLTEERMILAARAALEHQP